jgi:predicted amidophosphoribosyltransferase
VLGELIREHGWHVLGELAVLALALVVTVLWVVALIRGHARPVVCPACGRFASRAHATCPRCGEPLHAAGSPPVW